MTVLRPGLAILMLAACASCATDPAPIESSLSFDDVAVGGAREMPPGGPFPEGRIGPNGETILQPASAEIEDGVAYRFSLGHCGLLSPVDIDGSFWDELDGTTANGQPLDLGADSEMINATAGVVVVIGDEARFRTESGSIIRFARHEGDKGFPGCA
jgi:hypothetical protein